jgi:hypothetical protein
MKVEDLVVRSVYNLPTQYTEPKKIRYTGSYVQGGQTWYKFSEEMCYKGKTWLEIPSEDVESMISEESALEATLVVHNKETDEFDRWDHNNTVIFHGDRRQTHSEQVKMNKSIPLEVLSVSSLKESHPEVYFEVLEDYFNNKYDY